MPHYWENTTTVTLARPATRADLRAARNAYDAASTETRYTKRVGDAIELAGLWTWRGHPRAAHRQIVRALRAALPDCGVTTLWLDLEPPEVTFTTEASAAARRPAPRRRRRIGGAPPSVRRLSPTGRRPLHGRGFASETRRHA
ncbi:MAG: hypothetical protein IT379_30255 [Deltaproteobacteria bacterium]|nr:hypothetical protein [Deltaproteobacteria bacterium]